jgi:hypothetical protein
LPLFSYSGTDERYYPTLGVEAAPGVVLDLAEAPDDGRWESAATPQDSAPLPLENPQPEAAADPAPTNL